MTRLLLLQTLVALFIIASTTANSCLDNDGKAVDWSFTYKMPNGYKNAYIDANSESTGKDGLPLWKNDLDNKDAPPALIRTLLALEDKGWIEGGNLTSSAEEYMLYNDEPDQGTASSSYGKNMFWRLFLNILFFQTPERITS